MPIKCPRARSSMTPCYVRDGDLAVALRSDTTVEPEEICVGCDWRIEAINALPRKPN